MKSRGATRTRPRLDRLDHDRGDLLGRDVGHERPLERAQRLVCRGRGSPVGTDPGRPRARTARAPPCRGASSRSSSSEEVRPWKAPSNAITAGGFVYERANSRVDRLRAGVEDCGLRRSGEGAPARAGARRAGMYTSYGTILKSVCANRRAAPAPLRARMRVADVETSTPPVKSMNVFPSTSVSVAPRPSAADRQDQGGLGDHAVAALEDLPRARPRSRFAARSPSSSPSAQSAKEPGQTEWK